MSRFVYIAVLGLVFSAHAQELPAGPLSLKKFVALPSCSAASQDKVDAVETFLKSTYKRIVAEKKVYSWEMEDRKSRTPHYCAYECACVVNEFSAALKSTLGKYVELFSIRVQGGSGLLPVEIQREKYKSSYQYHVATLIKIKSENCYVIVDPIMNSEIELISTESWANQIVSINDNKIFASKP